jgi:ATP-binding cassette subfamily B protein
LTTEAQTIAFNVQDSTSESRIAGLWRLMAGFHLTYLGANLSLGFAAALKTGTYLLLRYFIDEVLVENAVDLLPFIGLGFIGLALLEGGFTFLSGRLAALTAEGVTIRLRNYLYDHIQRLTFAYHDKTPTGELIQRATSDVDAVRRFFAEQAIGVGRILLLFLINFGVILTLNWQLALLSVVVIPVIVVLSLFFFKRIFAAYESYQEQDAVVSTVLQENLSGIRVVKSFARGGFEREKFAKENWEKFQRGQRLLRIHSFYWPVSDIIAGLQTVGGFLIGAWMALNGTITIGTYLAYAGMVVWIIWPMRNLGRLIVQTSIATVSYGRVTQVLKELREPLEEGSYQPSGDVTGKIVFDEVCFQYEVDTPVLKDISFEISPGQVIALLGSTGSGKSTLVNLLPRFYDYSAGSLTLDNIELKAYPRSFLRSQIGIVEQEPFLFSRTIRENIGYGVEREIEDEEIEQAARAAEIHDVITGFPNGYNTLVGEKGVTLSGGQKQRIAIARALLKDPRILILDDATSSVDTETDAKIRGALEGLMKGRTTFIVAHRVQSAMQADLILVLDDGRIVQHGTHQELLSQPGTYKEIYELQARIEDELEKELSAFEGINRVRI